MWIRKLFSVFTQKKVGNDVPVIAEAIAEPVPPDEFELAHSELQAASQELERFELLHRGWLKIGDGQGGFSITADLEQQGIAARQRWNYARHRFESLLEENVQRKRQERHDYFASPGKSESPAGV